MPSATVTLEDGRRATVTWPEGTKSETEVYDLATAADPKGAGRRFLEGVPRGLVRGLEAGAVAATEMADPIGSATRFGLRAAGLPGGENPVRQAFDIGREKVEPLLPTPRGEAGGYGETLGEFAGNPLSWAGPGSVLSKGASVIGGALGSEWLGQKFKGTPGEGIARFVGGVGGGSVAPLAAGARSVITAPKTHAAADLSRALERDRDTAEALQARLEQARVLRPDATIADVAKQNVRDLVERIAQTPGAGRGYVVPTMEARQKQQAARMIEDLAALTGSRDTAFASIERTKASRKAAAGPLYDEAYNFDARSDPEIVQAWRMATETGWGRDVLNSDKLRLNLQSEYGIHAIEEAPLMKLIDAWQRQARARAEGAAPEDAESARIIGKVRRDLLEVVDRANPAFLEARRMWAGSEQYERAIEDGMAILGEEPAEATIARLRRYSEAQMEGYRIGAIAAIRAKWGRSKVDLPNFAREVAAPEMRTKIAGMMPTAEAAEAWVTALEHELGASRLTGQALRGSQTYRRQAERADVDGLIAELGMSLLTGHAKHMLFSLLQKGPVKIRDKMRSKADLMLGETLLEPGADIDAALRAAPPPPTMQSVVRSVNVPLSLGPLSTGP